MRIRFVQTSHNEIFTLFRTQESLSVIVMSYYQLTINIVVLIVTPVQSRLMTVTHDSHTSVGHLGFCLLRDALSFSVMNQYGRVVVSVRTAVVYIVLSPIFKLCNYPSFLFNQVDSQDQGSKFQFTNRKKKILDLYPPNVHRPLGVFPIYRKITCSLFRRDMK